MPLEGKRLMPPMLARLGLRAEVRIVVCALLAGIAAPTSDVLGADIRLKAVTFLPPHTSFIAPFQTLVERVNESELAIQLDILGGPEAVPPFEQANAVRIGAIDIAVVPVNYYRGVLLEAEMLQLVDLPFDKLVHTDAWMFLRELHNKQGLHLWTVYGDTVPFHTYLRRPVDRLDFSGLRLRVTPVYQAFYSALGADTVTIAPSEVYTALERGLIDGLGWPIWDVTAFGWDRFLHYRIDPGFYNTAIAVLVNAERWQSLDPAVVTGLEEIAEGFQRTIRADMEARSRLELHLQDAAGIVAIDLGAEVAATADGVYWDYLLEERPETVGQLRALVLRDRGADR